MVDSKASANGVQQGISSKVHADSLAVNPDLPTTWITLIYDGCQRKVPRKVLQRDTFGLATIGTRWELDGFAAANVD